MSLTELHNRVELTTRFTAAAEAIRDQIISEIKNDVISYFEVELGLFSEKSDRSPHVPIGSRRRKKRRPHARRTAAHTT